MLSIDGECAGKERVYDLTVEGAHEYFANGILVHNCMDAFRYGCYTPLAQAASGNYTIGFPQKRISQNALFHH